MPVYAIQAGENGPVKIGKADDVIRRLCDLQVGCWLELRLIALWEGGEAEEAVLHARFSHLHLRGDWHSFSKEFLGDVGLPPLPIVTEIDPVAAPDLADGKPIFHQSVGDNLRRARLGLKLTQAQAASSMGVDQTTWSKWEKAERIPNLFSIHRFCALHGVPLADVLPAMTPTP